MKKIICVLLSAVIIASLFSNFAFAADDAGFDGKTVVIYTANVRGNVDVYPKAAALKKDYASKGADVVLADLGNYLQGTVYSSFDSGKSIVGLMSAAGYDVASLGSHEFDFGTGTVGVEQHEILYADESLGKLLSNASFKTVSANIITSDGSLNAFSPTAEITVPSGAKLGFFGLTAQNTVQKVLEANLSGLEFTSPKDAAESSVAALKASGCSLIFGLSNAGVGEIDGAAMLEITSDATFTLGVLIIDNATGEKVSDKQLKLSDITSDSDVDKSCSAVKAAAASEYPAASVAKNSVTLNGLQSSVRGGETNTGDLWCDALLWFASEGNISDYYGEDDIANGNTGISVPKDHIVALWNGGNLRDFINTGDVTIKDIKRVLPYPNKVAVMYLTGSKLLETLEAASQGLPYSSTSSDCCAAFPQVAGLTYTVSENIPYDAGEAYGDFWFRADSVGRVRIDSVNGLPFNENDVYAVVTSNAIFNGMDAYYTSEYKDAENSAITSAAVSDVVWLYITEKLGGTIGNEYAQPDGRITLISQATTDVSTENTADAETVSNNVHMTASESDTAIQTNYGAPQTGDALIAVSVMLAIMAGAYLIIKR